MSISIASNPFVPSRPDDGAEPAAVDLQAPQAPSLDAGLAEPPPVAKAEADAEAPAGKGGNMKNDWEYQLVMLEISRANGEHMTHPPGVDTDIAAPMPEGVSLIGGQMAKLPPFPLHPLGPLTDPLVDPLPVPPTGSDYAPVLKERGIPHTVEPESFARSRGRVHYASLQRNGQFHVQPGDQVVNVKAYRDTEGKVVYVEPDNKGHYDLPEGARAIDVKELRHNGKLLGRDFGPPEAWLKAIDGAKVTAGDPKQSLRLQVAVDTLRHPELARFIDPGTGQVNPLEWQEFQNAAREAGLPMLVSSNGLGNHYQQARDNVRLLAEGKDVLAVNVYNPTIDGHFPADATREALPAIALRTQQTVQVGIESQLREAMAYNKKLSAKRDSKGEKPQPLIKTEFVGHSQGTINGNLAIERMKTDEKKQLKVYNVGTASNVLPERVASFTNIVDANDGVVQAAGFVAGGRKLNQQPYAQQRPDTYRLVETDVDKVVGKKNAGNHHSFYLYAQTPEFQKALGFKPRPTPVLMSKPFVD
ncbi:MAG: hypothetical protein LBE78_08910 [Burkholderiaceae bacterium]|jgi:hypothetical protein|nr:hypothetical protein [Burkholderiaceae bacterium]